MQNRRQSKKSSASNIVIGIFILPIVFLGILFVWYQNLISPIGNDSEIQIKVEAGESRDNLAQKLVDQGLIRNENAYIWYTRISGEGGNIKAGSHVLNQNMSVADIVEKLESNPDEITIWVTIPEGLRYDQIAERLDEAFSATEYKNFDKERFVDLVQNPRTEENSGFLSEKNGKMLAWVLPEGKPLEGMLYPETYNFNVDDDEGTIVNKLLDQFFVEVKDIDIKDENFYQDLILSSIVEKESLNEVDRGNVASVFKNRLAIGMKLQSDATVNYGLNKSERRPSLEDINSDNPYNTYKIPGLPPTPINNPRIESIQLSVDPPETNYLFFIHEEDGTPHFGKTANEHYRNVCKYLDKTC